MTHSPTPDNGLDVGPDNVDGLRMLAGIADTATPQSIVIQATTAALSANPMLDYKDVKRYFTAVLAKVKADAVAEYKAKEFSEEEVLAAAQAAYPGVDWREPEPIYTDAFKAYGNSNITTTAQGRSHARSETERCMKAQRKAMIDARAILEAARGAR